MELKEQIKYTKNLIKMIKHSLNTDYLKIWVGEGDVEVLNEILQSLNRLKKIEK